MATARRWMARKLGGSEALELVELELADPGPGEVRIEVCAAGMNPIDYKLFAPGQDPAALPVLPGSEVAGVISALGADAEIASGGGAIGDEVLAYRAMGGYSTALTLPAADVFAKPAELDFEQAANLLLAGTTAAETLAVVALSAGETVLVHGAAGGVGTSAVQQALALGAIVIGTAGERNFDQLRRLGVVPVAYGPGLEDRVRAAAPQGIDCAVDTVGVDEALDVSLALVADRRRIVSIAGFRRAAQDGFQVVGAANPTSRAFRAAARPAIIALAAAGKLEVPVAQTFAFDDAPRAVQALAGRHPYGKLALIP